MRDSFVSETANKASFSSSATSDKSSRVLDNFEPINIEGQQETGIWVHQPGSEVSQTWEPRKGKSKRLDNQVDGVPGDSFGRTHSTTSGPLNNEVAVLMKTEGKSPMNKVRQGLHKISSVFHRGTKNEESLGSNEETVPSPYANIKAVNQKEIESPGKGNVKDKAKSFLKRAEKSARNIKHVLSRKRSRKPRSGVSDVTELEISLESDSSDDESHTSPEVQRIPVVSSSTSSSYGSDHYDKIKENVVEAGSSEFAVDAEDQMKVNVEGLGRIDENEVANSNGGNGNGLEELSKPQQTEKKLDGNGPEEFTNSRVSEEKLEGEMGSDAENIHDTSLG
ncbi:hypothetical protein GH714_026744 [Hevea brasiliensis]|uniref:Uncharacterized protein n=1 Tax=Hevea brasiliensis TaxID=3981 RepID=A0A6A6MMH6_HEVBR|nr:hypothetical protein GH714_026744 [Hevea brasiliensis]